MELAYTHMIWGFGSLLEDIFFKCSSLFTEFIPSITFYMRRILQVCYCLLDFLYTVLASWRPECFIIIWPFGSVSLSLSAVSNTRFIAAVIERHTHSPERRRRYWGRSGTESDHGKSAYVFMCTPSSKSKEKTILVGLKWFFWNKGQRKIQRRDHQISYLRIYWEFYYWNKAKPSPVAQCILLFALDFIGGSRLGLHGVYSAC